MYSKQIGVNRTETLWDFKVHLPLAFLPLASKRDKSAVTLTGQRLSTRYCGPKTLSRIPLGICSACHSFSLKGFLGKGTAFFFSLLVARMVCSTPRGHSLKANL